MWNGEEPNEPPTPFLCNNRKQNMAQFLSYSWATMEGDTSRLDERLGKKDLAKLAVAVDLYFNDGHVNVSAVPIRNPPKRSTRTAVAPAVVSPPVQLGLTEAQLTDALAKFAAPAQGT